MSLPVFVIFCYFFLFFSYLLCIVVLIDLGDANNKKPCYLLSQGALISNKEVVTTHIKSQFTLSLKNFQSKSSYRQYTIKCSTENFLFSHNQ